jgi:hypothetical protein
LAENKPLRPLWRQPLFNVDHFDRIQHVEQHAVVAHPQTIPKGVVCERDNTVYDCRAQSPSATLLPAKFLMVTATYER